VPVEVIGIDHVFVAVRDMHAAKGFYDRVMPILGFRRGSGSIGGDPHVFYHGRQLVYALRPAREGAADHDPYAPGLHHLSALG
jgi:catechol 2,3-dioxygenase-like lactoylglutathione lyase family enzyme